MSLNASLSSSSETNAQFVSGPGNKSLTPNQNAFKKIVDTGNRDLRKETKLKNLPNRMTKMSRSTKSILDYTDTDKTQAITEDTLEGVLMEPIDFSGTKGFTADLERRVKDITKIERNSRSGMVASNGENKNFDSNNITILITADRNGTVQCWVNANKRLFCSILVDDKVHHQINQTGKEMYGTENCNSEARFVLNVPVDEGIAVEFDHIQLFQGIKINNYTGLADEESIPYCAKTNRLCLITNQSECARSLRWKRDYNAVHWFNDWRLNKLLPPSVPLLANSSSIEVKFSAIYLPGRR